MSDFKAPEHYLPHRAPMCLLTRVVRVDEEEVTCETDTTPDGVLQPHWNREGELPEAFALEIMAQTIGVWAHCYGNHSDIPAGDAEAQIGLLLSARSIHISGAVRCGDPTLRCVMRKLMLDGRLAVFEGELFSGDKPLASGRLTVYQPLESEMAELFCENKS